MAKRPPPRRSEFHQDPERDLGIVGRHMRPGMDFTLPTQEERDLLTRLMERTNEVLWPIITDELVTASMQVMLMWAVNLPFYVVNRTLEAGDPRYGLAMNAISGTVPALAAENLRREKRGG